MKILFCSIYLPTGEDGVSNSSRQLVSVLRSKGVDIQVCTTDWGWPDAEKRKERSEGLNIFDALLDNDFDCSIPLLGYINKTCKQFDILHFNSIYSVASVFGSLIAGRNRVPYVICPQGNFIPSANGICRVRKSVFKKKLFFNLFSRNALRKADRVICNSESEMKSVSSLTGTDNISYISNGIDTAPYRSAVRSGIIEEKLGIGPDKNIFLFLGRLAEEKAIPFLLDVWEEVTKKMSDAVLVIAGPDVKGSLLKIRERIRRLTCPESVLLPGAVTGSLKTALLRHSKCLLLPSWFESFGNVVLESLASGTPVIASAGTPWKSLEDQNLGRWLPWDVNKWVEAIIEVSQNKYFHNNVFSTKSMKWVSDNFNWDDIADKYIGLYEEILSNRSAVS